MPSLIHRPKALSSFALCILRISSSPYSAYAKADFAFEPDPGQILRFYHETGQVQICAL